MSVLFMIPGTSFPALDENQIVAAMRANGWLKVAANNLQSGLNAIKSHEMPSERLQNVIDDLLSIIHDTDCVLAANNSQRNGARNARANKASGNVVRTQRPGDGCQE